jgi:hypothetical protein
MTQLLQCEDASCIADCFHKFEKLFDGSSVAQAVGQYLTRDANNMDKSSQAGVQEADRLKIASSEMQDVLSAKVEEAKTRNEGGVKMLTKLRRGEEACNTLKSFKDGEKSHESIFKSLTPVCTPCNANKVQPLGVASPRGQKKKSGVVRLSFTRKSFDGDQTTEICELSSDVLHHLFYIRVVQVIFEKIVDVKYLWTGSSRRYLIRPRAGLLIPQTSEKISEGCWSVLEPSTFKLRGETFFR